MSEKIDLGAKGFIYPMPMTLVGADRGDDPNFMPVAWINRVQYTPARIAAGMNKNHATNEGIREHGQFSVCIPSESMLAVTDWCGLNSATSGVNKASQFELFRGNLDHAPLIAECPLCIECTLMQAIDLGSHELFVGEVAGTWTEQRYLEDGNPDVVKMKPFMLTMPDNRYWSVGDEIGRAWSAGRDYQPNS